MSVLVKGMDMPERCEVCPLSTEVCVVEGIAWGCVVNMRIREKECNTRPDWCPLVEVPAPHGRLIIEDGEIVENS